MYKQIAANKRNTIFLMIGFVVFISLIGCIFAYAFKDWHVSVYVLAVSATYALIQYFLATSLAVAMTGAKETRKQNVHRYPNQSVTTTIQPPGSCKFQTFRHYILQHNQSNPNNNGFQSQQSNIACGMPHTDDVRAFANGICRHNEQR